MREYTDRCLNLAEVQGASYADIRIVERKTQTIIVKNGVVQRLAEAAGVIPANAWPAPRNATREVAHRKHFMPSRIVDASVATR